MLSCKEVVKILSTDDKASWKRRIEVRMHLFLCHNCSNYMRQLEHLKKGFRNLFQAKSKEATSEEILKIQKEVIRKIKGP